MAEQQHEQPEGEPVSDPATELPEAAPTSGLDVGHRPVPSAVSGLYNYVEAPERRRRTRNRAKVRLLAIALAGAGGLLVFVVLTAGVAIRMSASEKVVLAERVHALELEKAALSEQLERLTADRDLLLLDRNPGLQRLGLDRNLRVSHDYVRDVLFTRTGKSGGTQYEYRLVFENRESGPVQPKVEILLFDELGIQIGRATVNGADVAGEWLEPGEIRTRDGQLVLVRQSEPTYFLIELP